MRNGRSGRRHHRNRYRRRQDFSVLRVRHQQRQHRSGFISAPGTNHANFAQGDELIINDQVTTTHLVKGGYPIVGFDSGVCTLTRIPEKYPEQTIGNCVATVVVKGGSLTVQGAIRFTPKPPEAGTLAVTGGTVSYDGVTGQVGVSFTKNDKILAFLLK